MNTEAHSNGSEYMLCDAREALEEMYAAGLSDYSRLVIARRDVSGLYIYHTRYRWVADEDQQLALLVIDE